MSVVGPAIGLFVALVVAAGVFLHATQMGSSRRSALLWAGGVGGGFLVATAFDGAIYRLYFYQLKPRPIAVSPYEVTAVLVAAGTGISVLGVLLYRIVRRVGSDSSD